MRRRDPSSVTTVPFWTLTRPRGCVLPACFRVVANDFPSTIRQRREVEALIGRRIGNRHCAPRHASAFRHVRRPCRRFSIQSPTPPKNLVSGFCLRKRIVPRRQFSQIEFRRVSSSSVKVDPCRAGVSRTDRRPRVNASYLVPNLFLKYDSTEAVSSGERTRL